MLKQRSYRLLSFMVTFCMIMAMLPVASAEGSIISVNSSDENAVRNALSQAQDGDIIEITGTGFINDTNSDGAPWVIDKAVTIRGAGTDPSLLIRSGGIILGADVSFENIKLSLPNHIRNAIIANGYTLTLTSVTRDTSARAIHLFCGGRTGGSAPASGPHGQIIIQDCPDLGNIYAGSISSDGQDNNSAIPATVTILPSSSSVGEIYACGALESYVDPNQMLNPDYEVLPPTPSATKYPVSGAVMFNLYSTTTASVDGATGGDRDASVSYTGGQYPNNGLTLKNISSLALASGGMLTPTADSVFPADISISVPSGTTLGMTELGNLEIGSLSGGGALVLGQQQTLTINDGVTGTTQVGVGSIFNGTSQQIPVENHTYICAPQSSQDAFALIPHNAQPGAQLERDANGNWTIPMKTVEEAKLQSLAPADVQADSGETEAIVPLHSVYSGDGLNLYEIPLTIRVNGSVASYDASGKYYESAGLRLYVGNTGNGDELQIYDGNDPFYSPIPDGVYRIEITVPGTYTVSGADISASCTLTIGETSPAPVSIPVPLAKSGLKWTGTEQVGVEEGTGYTLTGHRGTNVGGYTAVATLESGYQWLDGSSSQKTISWRIEKADGPAAPIGLSATPPTAAGSADGEILGVTPAMEYATKQDFSDAVGCVGTEITGLTAGTFFVRFRETATHEAGASVSIAVPDFNAPTVTAVSIISTDYKIAYQVGDSLDVAGLTIKVNYSDGSSQTVPVTANMVSGFDSSQAVANQILTISYGGQTVSYEIQITQSTIPDPSHQHNWVVSWSTNTTHHWHECGSEDCPIQQNSLKSGYDAHSAGVWVIDQAATTTQNGSRHRSCSVCGYEMVREVIPATGGSSSGGSSSGGGSYSNTTTNTERNPDGSTTTTTVNRSTGTVTETTRTAGGDTVTVETRKDGVVTTTERTASGSTTKTTEHPNGSVETDVRLSNGTTASASTDVRGRTFAQTSLSARAIEAARKDSAAVSLPVPSLSAVRISDSASQVEITLPRNTGSVKVEIPVQNAGPGVVAVIVGTDGSEAVVKKSTAAGDGIALTLDASATVKIVDNSTAFSDVPASSWARSAVDFVSAREIFYGTGSGAFSPDSPMTRGMMAVVLHNLEGSPDYRSASRLSDVSGNWYSDSVYWAVEQGIASGYSDGRFGPNDSINREQLAVMLWRYAGSPAATNRELNFADGDQASGYALEALCWASESGIIGGVGGGQLSPQGLATRVQVAQMLMNYIQMAER